MKALRASAYAASFAVTCSSPVVRASPFAWAARTGAERMSEQRGPEWGAFVDGEVGVHVHRHVSVTLFGVVARTTDEHGFRGGPVNLKWSGDHFSFADLGVRAQFYVGPIFLGLGIGVERVTQSGTLTYRYPPPVESFSAPVTEDDNLVEFHAGYVLPRLGVGAGWCLEAFAALQHDFSNYESLDTLRVGVGIASR